ncbi:MAG: TRAP-type transport system periplasmic protein [Thermosediminibacterales bacterium]|nr:TRAP-type transport system periplasmic protein [Thermosediminibacterales bacterium]MDK2836909.1 TRAP-type transport system periplasmic protein [Thermosediminibacterales bacterium]
MLKSYKKLFVLFIIAIFTVSLLSGCGGGSDNKTAGDGGKNEVIEIKLSHSSPAVDDRLEAACQEFKKVVEEKTNGKVKVTTYPANQLGGEREQLEGVQMGTIQMAALSSGPLPGIFPEIMVFDMPYLFSSEKVAYEVLDGPVGQEILDMLREKTGVRGLVWGENGFRHFTNSIRPIEKPSDVKGLKIRTMENPAHMAIVRALGGDPTPMSFGEVYTALSQKTIDGQENPISLIVSMRFYEAQDYLTLDGHVYNPYILLINDEFYNSLDDEIKKAIDEAALVWRKTERELNQKQCEEGLKKLKDEGMQITELSLEQKQAFRDATKSVYEDFGKKEIGEELLNKVLDAVKKAESK